MGYEHEEVGLLHGCSEMGSNSNFKDGEKIPNTPTELAECT